MSVHEADELIETIAPWDGRRVPVTLIGGYLGSGKTTLINELLSRTDRPIAVLVNDVGEINIDAALIGRRSGDTIELTDGCVCCSLREGLANAFAALRDRPDAPDHVLIELSGVADPHRVAPWGDSDGFRLDSIVVLVDAQNSDEQWANELIRPTIERQLEAADLVIVTKSDRAEPDTVSRARARADESTDGVHVLLGAAADAAAVLDLGTRRPGGAIAMPSPQLFDPHVVQTRALPRPITVDQIEALLDELPVGTVRAKGIAVDPDGGRLLVQVVGRRRRITALPAAEDQLPTDLVVISVEGETS